MRTISIVLLSLALGSVIAKAHQSLNNFKVEKDIVWASPDGFDLTMDVYSPEAKKKLLPVLVIFHGGGWLINNKSIMDEMSQYIVEHGDYVVCNVNYRLLVDQENTVTMDQIIEDVFGGVLWVKENISKFGGDPNAIAVTGDSAGGHLAASVVMMGDHLSNTGFDQLPLGFNPSYLPKGKSAEDIKKADGIRVQAGLLSYGAFDIYANALGGFEQPSNFFWQMGGAAPRSIFGGEINAKDNPEYYKAVSPSYNVPKASEKQLPPLLLTVGSKDDLVTPESVKAFASKLKAAGHSAEYWEYEGRPHAFLDSGANEFLGTSFEKDAPTALDVMLKFMDSVFKK